MARSPCTRHLCLLHSQRIGYLAASQCFHEGTDVIMLTTNQIRKVGASHPAMGARGEWGLVGSGWSLPSSETPVVGSMCGPPLEFSWHWGTARSHSFQPLPPLVGAPAGGVALSAHWVQGIGWCVSPALSGFQLCGESSECSALPWPEDLISSC